MKKQEREGNEIGTKLLIESDLHRRYLDTTQTAMVALDASGCIIMINRSGSKLLGYDEDELMGRNWFEVCLPQPDGMEKVYPVFRRLMAGGDVQSVEYYENKVLCRNGTRRLVSWHNALLHGESGEIIGTLSSGQDITEQREIEAERKQAEEALRLRENFLGSIFRAAPVGIGVVIQRVFRNVNDRFCEITGYSHKELIGSNARMVYPSDDDYEQVGREKYRQIEKYGTGTVETRFRRSDGEIIHVLLSSTPLDPENLDAGVTFTAMDITLRRKAEQELERYKDRLEKLVDERTIELKSVNRELEAFAYSVSHDLRAPLRAMGGFSSILLEEHQEQLDEQGRDFLQRIQNGSVEMGQLIDGLLLFSRSSRGALKREAVDLSAMAGEICARIDGDNPDRRVEWSIEPGLQAVVDRRLIRVVLENMLMNGWKFTAGKPRAEVEFFSLADGVKEYPRLKGRVYCIRDNGAGFDMRYVNKLFGPFQRLHRQDEFRGTGIGLATVQRIIRRHGGDITAWGKVGKEAVFYFTLMDENTDGKKENYPPRGRQ